MSQLTSHGSAFGEEELECHSKHCEKLFHDNDSDDDKDDINSDALIPPACLPLGKIKSSLIDQQDYEDKSGVEYTQ